ncbi:MAG TPA: dienelactone hydrolase family protein [Terriglobales bacterium]|jgi:carboxymethylenebutenolidase|nr:dienelactone hydrolase family protein [Terriglobales bacterium]
MDLKTEYATLAVDDGTSMRSYVARPAAPVARGLIVCQEAFGVNAHIRDVSERFARLGFLAIAPELFHRTAPGFEGRYDDFPSVMSHMRALSDEGMAVDLRAAYAWLTANGGSADFPVAVVGFCMGGRAAVLTALTVPAACAVSFYGGGIAPNANNPGLLNRMGELRAPVLLFWGGRDKHIGPDQIRSVTEALRDAGKNYINVEISDADHGFFCDARASYNPVAASQAWPLVVAFLDTYTSHRQPHP